MLHCLIRSRWFFGERGRGRRIDDVDENLRIWNRRSTVELARAEEQQSVGCDCEEDRDELTPSRALFVPAFGAR